MNHGKIPLPKVVDLGLTGARCLFGLGLWLAGLFSRNRDLRIYIRIALSVGTF